MSIRSRGLWAGLLLLLAMGASLLLTTHTALADEEGGPSFEMFGVIQQLPNTAGFIGDWKVNNLTVHVTDTTEIKPNLQAVHVGAFVRVAGRLLVDGTIQANRIQVMPAMSQVEFFGVIQSLPSDPQNGDWKVNSLTVHVSTTTEIKPKVQAAVVGAYVKVKGAPQSDGSINASKIEVLSSGNNDRHVKFVGVVLSLPPAGLIGDWTVSAPMSLTGMTNAMSMMTTTVTVHVTNTTQVDEEHGKVAVGVTVKVEGVVQSDKSVNAGEIDVVFAPPSPGQSVEFLGRIQQLPTGTLIGDWVVSDRTVHVAASTQIDEEHAKAVVGAFVKVKGILQADKSVNATEIQVRAGPPPPPTRYIKFYGVVQEVPASGVVGTYKINGLTVNVTAQTKIEHGPIVVNAIVEVKGVLQTDGTVDALKIEVKGMAPKANSLFGRSSAVGQIGK
jgi:hypothetical protein